ncbi:Zn-dependent amino-or carboxypeptidase, M28 family [Microbulbifer donghaiensis]|uniref:Zn-dependent amino-or carboxypeptidase, M28 family n=1 Tax=Microbulbifer donghaiensis TaxID=494016 RepID=A0A1M5AZR9_9GAMM|nr:M28 family metallopeptidase [Microbulbifer donghaiensis]SHF35656.1 Zn-dependent amino-or carboxypeptidase, M28 family [Microbulbifer donghaiensis]
MKFKTLLGALVVGALVACATTSPAPIPSADSLKIQSHVAYLAADELAGRETGSAGYREAADYVARQFELLGLQPAGNQGYLQQVPFRRASWSGREPTLVLQGRDGDITFKFGEDFIAAPPTISEDTATTANLVFVGFGIEAPDYGIDDYAGLDVQGKIVVILSGRPKNLPNEVGAHYASTRTKRETAARHGAVGYITLNTPERERRTSFKRATEHLHEDSFAWIGADDLPGDAIPGLHPGVMLDMPAARQLFMGAERSLDTIYTETKNGLAPRGFALPYRAALTSGAAHKKILSPNVVAMLPGSDPRLKDEYVVFSAHLDHIGVDPDGQVNNGAQDNAAGIAVMLETARLFIESGRAPRRSLLFVAVTAEEEGLLGSDYFAQHPPVPPQSIVANINLDMPMLLYPFRDIIAFGAEHSTLGKTAERAARRTGLKLSPDPMPEQVIFVRSDHYNFVRQGVPAIYLITGREALDPEIDGTAMQVKFLQERYHRPTDTADEQIDYAAAKQFTEVNYAIAREVADADRKPHWYKGDFFGELFSRQ